MESHDFPIQANWGKVPDEKKILIDLIDHKSDRIDAVLNCTKENDDALWTEQLLAPDNLDRFLVVPDFSHVKGCKLKSVKLPSKKRPTSLASSEAPDKRPCQMEGEAPIS